MGRLTTINDDVKSMAQAAVKMFNMTTHRMVAIVQESRLEARTQDPFDSSIPVCNPRSDSGTAGERPSDGLCEETV